MRRARIVWHTLCVKYYAWRMRRFIERHRLGKSSAMIRYRVDRRNAIELPLQFHRDMLWMLKKGRAV